MTAFLTPSSRMTEPAVLGTPSFHHPRRRTPLLALLVAALLAAGWILYDQNRGPRTLDEAELVGPRSPTPIALVVLLDGSGSFDQYQAIRREALAEVLRWSETELRPDDTLTILEFAETADVVLPTTAVGAISPSQALRQPIYSKTGTSIVPVLQLAAQLRQGTAPSSLIVVTDTEVGDADPAVVDPIVAALRVTTATLVRPDDVAVTPQWAATFGYELELTADQNSTESTSLAMATAIAHATGQRLDRR